MERCDDCGNWLIKKISKKSVVTVCVNRLSRREKSIPTKLKICFSILFNYLSTTALLLTFWNLIKTSLIKRTLTDFQTFLVFLKSHNLALIF